jgi:hypothetical protein
MKRLVGIALGMALGATIVQAGGSIGGVGLYYDAVGYTLRIPDKLAERFAVLRQNGGADSNLTTYSIKADDFVRLQNLADSRLTVSGKDSNDETRSYWVYSGDEINELMLIDRRAKMRNGRPQY